MLLSCLLCLQITFKIESLIPTRVESSSLDFGFQPILLVRKQCNLDIRVTQPIQVPGSKLLPLQQQQLQIHLPLGYLDYFQLQCLGGEVVVETEVDVAALLGGLPLLVTVQVQEGEGATLQERKLERRKIKSEEK